MIEVSTGRSNKEKNDVMWKMAIIAVLRHPDAVELTQVRSRLRFFQYAQSNQNQLTTPSVVT